MSSIKLSSLYELKHEIAKLVRLVKRKTGQEAFKVELQDNLIKLVKHINGIVKRKIRVTVYIYDDEYTINYFTDSVRWSAGVDENGLVNYCYIDKETPLKKGRFSLTEEIPEEFNIILDKLNAEI